MPGCTAAVWNVESLVHPHQGISVDNNQLDDIAEAVEDGLVVEPAGVGGWSHGEERNTGTERGAEGQEGGGEEDEDDLGVHGAVTEVVGGVMAGEQQAEEDPRDGDEGEDGDVDAGYEADVANLAEYRGVEGVEAVDDGGDDHDEAGEDTKVEEAEGEAYGLAPAEIWVQGAEDALEEDDVDDVEEEDARIGEDAGGDGDPGVGGVAGPDDAQDVGHDAGHAEAEGDGGDDELVVAAAVDLEDGHVEGGGAGEEEDEYC